MPAFDVWTEGSPVAGMDGWFEPAKKWNEAPVEAETFDAALETITSEWEESLLQGLVRDDDGGWSVHGRRFHADEAAAKSFEDSLGPDWTACS